MYRNDEQVLDTALPELPENLAELLAPELDPHVASALTHALARVHAALRADDDRGPGSLDFGSAIG